MKKIAILLIGIIPFAALGQKEIKPSISNAEKALRANKIVEAINIIDVTTSNQEFMLDKKGNPSKNAAKAWYLKGVIYAATDTVKSGGTENIVIGTPGSTVKVVLGEPKTNNRTTTTSSTSEQWVYGENVFIYIEDGKVSAIQDSNSELASLISKSKFQNEEVKKIKAKVPEGFPIAKEAFDKAKALDKDELAFLKDAAGVMPMFNKDVNAYLAQAYFNIAINAYQDDQDYKKAFAFTEKTLYFIPEDTSILMNAGVFFGPSAEEYEKSIDYIKKYQEMGGKSTDAYIMLFSIYRDKLKDNDKALALAQELVKKFPGNAEYPKFELDLYIKMNRLPEAKAVMEKQAAADPTDKESRYFLGVISMELGDPKEAKKWYEEAIKIDPKYFEPQLGLADLIYTDARKTKAEMNQLGNSKEDFKKKVELDKKYQEELRVALPYWEKCEKLSPDEGKVLDNLYMIYNDLEMTAQVSRIEKRMKALGLFD